MNVFLIRHPQTEWNRAGIIQGRLDSPWTLRGQEECNALIAGLQAEGVTPGAVISSPAGRAQQMAACIATHFACDFQLHDALQEQHFGELEGRSLSEIQRAYPPFIDDEHFCPPQGESLAQAAQRLRTLLHRLPDVCSQETVALVSHGHVIQAVIAQLMENSLSNVARYHHPNASFSLLVIEEKTCRVMRWGIASHLLRLPA